MEHIKSPIARFLVEHANTENKLKLLLKEKIINKEEFNNARSKL